MKRKQIESEGLLKSATAGAVRETAVPRCLWRPGAADAAPHDGPAPVKVIAAGDRPEPRPAGTTRLDSGVLVSVDATGTVDVRSGDGVTTFETGTARESSPAPGTWRSAAGATGAASSWTAAAGSSVASGG